MSRTSIIRNQLEAFGRDTRGAIAIIFALTLVMVLTVIGLAVDTGRAMRAGNSIGAAVDAAVIAGVKGLRLQNMTDAEILDLVRNIFDSNIQTSGLSAPTINGFDVTINRSNSSIELAVDAEIKTVLGGLAGIDTLQLPRRSVAIYENKDVEVALQLDVTGSMNGKKIADLKVATKDLVDILIPDDITLLGGQTVRIGLAPYAAGINAGSYASLMNGNVTAPDSCVYERLSDSFQDSDAYPSGAAVLKTKLDLVGANTCPTATVLPMTANKTVLKSTVDSFTASGTTAGHLGTSFAWYLLSPEWASIWPVASQPTSYNSGTATKVAVLMTDGLYNTVGGKMSSANEGGSANFAVDACTQMKSKGIIVYTVGFKLNASRAVQTLKDCASHIGKFYEAKDGEALRIAFRAIAEDIATLRLSE